MEIFEDLGSRIARDWSKHRFSFDSLPDIAATELDRTPLHKATDYKALLQWVNSTDTFPSQINMEATFGEPPLTVFWHPNFYIEALYWCTSTTSVHGHGFLGAFQVLAGTSLQSEFFFDSPQPSGKRCRIGTLRQTEASLLRLGSTQQILSGEDFVHSVFHLGYPSVTIVVRTFGPPPGRPQYTYFRPGVAVPFGLTFDQLTRRLLQIAKLQATLKTDDLFETVATIAAKCDLSAAFTLLQEVQPMLYAQNRVDVATQLVLILATAHGLGPISKLAEALTVERSLDPLRRARDRVVEDDLRLFLALLLTQQGRRFVMPIVTDYTGDPNPQGKVAGWIRELAKRQILNVPEDEGTEAFLTRWLDDSQSLASEGEAAETIAKIKAEPLLAPLLFEEAA